MLQASPVSTCPHELSSHPEVGVCSCIWLVNVPFKRFVTMWCWIWHSSGAEQARDCDSKEEERWGDNFFNFVLAFTPCSNNRFSCKFSILISTLFRWFTWRISCSPKRCSFEGLTSFHQHFNVNWTILFLKWFKPPCFHWHSKLVLCIYPFPSVGVVNGRSVFNDKLFQRLLQPPICCWRASIWLPRQPVTWKRWNNYCRFQISFAHHANSHILRTLDCLKWHLKMSWTPWLMRSFLASASTFTGYYLDNGFVTVTDSHISDLLKLGPGRFHSWQERRNHPCLLLATLMWGINLNLSFI